MSAFLFESILKRGEGEGKICLILFVYGIVQFTLTKSSSSSEMSQTQLVYTL